MRIFLLRAYTPCSLQRAYYFLSLPLVAAAGFTEEPPLIRISSTSTVQFTFAKFPFALARARANGNFANVNWTVEVEDILIKGGSSVKPAAATSGNDKK